MCKCAGSSDMARVAIITDSSADLPPEAALRAGITVVPLTESVISALPASASASARASGRWAGQRVVRPESREAFLATFNGAARTHDAVVAVLLSSRLGSAVAAAQEARDRFSGAAAIEIVDSRSASFGLGFQVLHAAELARQGMDAGAIAADLRAMSGRYHVVFSVESVDHLRQSGRIGRSAAMIADALQLKPLLRIDEGQIVPYERARTRTGAIAELAEFVQQLPGVERCAVLYATSEQDALQLAEAIRAECGLPPERLMVGQIGETIAAQVGPGALGVAVVEADGL
jgi:DegV family protein with EDD domain